jgi:hypothetical protein
MDLICTFVEVMKKIFFFLCIALLVLFMPAYAHALNEIPSHDYGTIRYNQLYISNTTHHQDRYFTADLFEEDSDDISTSKKEKFASGKNVFTIIPFILTNFPDNFLGKKSFPKAVLNYALPDFIYFRALRL